MKYRYAILFFLVAVLCFSHTALAGGSGISPSIVEMKELLRDNSYNKYFKILNLEDFSKNMSINPTGAAASWIEIKDMDTLENINYILVPPQGEKTFIARFNIPADAPNGVYEGYIDITPFVSSPTSGNVVSLVVRGYYRLEVTGTENKNASVESISAGSVESGQPLRIRYDIRNIGNVGIVPRIAIKVFKDDLEADSFEKTGEYIASGSYAVQELSWDTENRGTGQFSLDAAVYIDDMEIGKKSLNFTVEPRGTYTASGIAGAIEQPKDWKKSEVGKSSVKFYNTGKIDVIAKLVVEVQKEEKIVEVLSSNEVLVPAGQTGTLSYYFTPKEDGEFVLKPTIQYSGKELKLEDVTVSVFLPEHTVVNTDEIINETTETDYLTTGLIALIFVLLVAVVVFGALFFTSKKQKY